MYSNYQHQTSGPLSAAAANAEQQQLQQQYEQQQQQLQQQLQSQMHSGTTQQYTTTTTEQRSISVPRIEDRSLLSQNSQVVVQQGSPEYTTTTQTYTSRVPGSDYLTTPSQQYRVTGSSYGQEYVTSGGAASAGYAASSNTAQYGGASAGYTGAVSGGYSGAVSGGYSTTTTSGAYTTGSRVIGHEYGQERVISVNQRVDESRSHIINERFIEHTVKVPKRITREDIIEKIIIVPERVLNEEIIDEIATVKERIIEVAKPMIIEKVIEVPEIEYVEVQKEVIEHQVKTKEKYVDKVMYQEKIREVEKIIPQERIVEIPDIQYHDVPVERVVEVPDYREEIIWRDVPVPQYVNQPMPVLEQEEAYINVERHIPVAIEANTVYEYRLPKILPRYNKVTYPVYLPRFIEIPVAVELLNAGIISQSEQQLQQIARLRQSGMGAASLCEIENLGDSIKRADLASKVQTGDLQQAVLRAWQEGTLQIGGAATSTTTTTTMHQTTSAMLPQQMSPTLLVN